MAFSSRVVCIQFRDIPDLFGYLCEFTAVQDIPRGIFFNHFYFGNNNLPQICRIGVVFFDSYPGPLGRLWELLFYEFSVKIIPVIFYILLYKNVFQCGHKLQS